jgi:HSP20 family protein
MAIIKWDPLRDLETLRHRFNKLFEQTFSERGEKEIFSGTWIPTVDIRETEKEFVITAELPGLDEKDIELEIEDHNLVLRGKREFEKETKKEDYHKIERSYSYFYRSFSLPSYADVDKIKAEHDKGLLKISVPKSPELKPKKVKILPAAKSEK